MISVKDREKVIKLVEETCKAGVPQYKACKILGISERTLQRWQKASIQGFKADQRQYVLRTPGNKMSLEEKKGIIDICNSGEYKNLPPSQIVPSLADNDIYIASESSFYRVLRKEGQLAHRGKSKPAQHKKPKGFTARGPNQVWTWDITYLPSFIKGEFYYLYMITDIYSRKIVGWDVYDRQSDELSSALIKRAYLIEEVKGKEIVLHSDNGSPMKGATMLSTLQRLGVIPSFSRPAVSNDNPYSEALFKTLKYTPIYPLKPFDSINTARDWVLEFVLWYNTKHHHSGIKFVTPQECHCGKDREILENRKKVYERARKRNPERWSKSIRNWNKIEKVPLNCSNI